jgi:hypothetical protein
LTPAKEMQTPTKYYTFAKNCTNQFGSFKRGDRSRGAFPDDLIKSYLAIGILVDENGDDY